MFCIFLSVLSVFASVKVLTARRLLAFAIAINRLSSSFGLLLL